MKEMERKSFLLVVENKNGELGLGHNNKVTVPTEIPTPAEGFTLTDVQLRGCEYIFNL